MQIAWRQRIPLLVVGAIMVAAGFLILINVPDAVAQTDIAANLATVNEDAGLGEADIRVIIAKIIRIILGFLGIIAVSLVLYAGFLWMTSKGEAAKIEKAQRILINAGIGLVIILSSMAITQFILNRLAEATGFGSGSSDGPTEIISPFSSSLGAGIIESHYPRRVQTGVARNSNIVVTFRREMDPASIMASFDPTLPADPYTLDADAVTIFYENDDGDTFELPATDVIVNATPDFRTFVFNPVPLLGNAVDDIWYTVSLEPTIELADGDPAFTGAFDGGYRWRFRTSTIVDLTPPQVISVLPLPSTTNPRNMLVQVNYDEEINPISAVGTSPSPFTNLQVTDPAILSGDWTLNNGYRTSEFVTDLECGTNSCGETVYCLPALATLSALVRASDLDGAGPEALFPYSGIVDMAGNSLDGDSDGVAEGRPTDNYTWGFSTNNSVYLDPPIVTGITPDLVTGFPAGDIEFDQQVKIAFDSFLSTASVIADNLILHSPSENLWFYSTVEMLPPAITPTYHEVTMNHGLFSEDLLYGAEAKSGLRSIYQNCYTPSKSTSCSGPNCCNETGQSGLCVYPEYTYTPTP
jgi:hypothetical protein